MGCAKFRLNASDHSTIAGLPRLLDLGQCNDAYSVFALATRLVDALGCGLHELPLHFVFSWFEQKSVAMILTLLHLGFRSVHLGPSVPAFLTPRVWGLLHDEFG
eukprot:CAMPEP_0168361410 /NCGR_PEP_ID=MMETSP0228-20121227/2654_1 /TAXON_ID=133427 /ORGANISM="Protoceratium reticulatum, Strain CCCM 535 (=CCMP 1889)" /LENGTH=103 /DNA_ID=CAMNT_0008374091 /DNA_START=62 /DNA_END=369 /DNA_ORIENTATION=+